jgi:hypothetical protein
VSSHEDLIAKLSGLAASRLRALLKTGQLSRIDADIVRAHFEGVRMAGGISQSEVDLLTDITLRQVVEEGVR